MFTQEIIKIREKEGRGRMTFRRIFAIRSPLSEHIHHSHEFLPFLSRGESSLSLSVSRKPEENGKFFAIRSSSENETRYPPLMEERTVVTEELDRSLSRYFPLESNNDGPGLKASKASHTSVKPFLRFFSFGFNFPALYVHARTHKTRAKHSRSPLDSWGHKRGLFFSSRSIVRPTRFLLSFLFSFSSSSLLPFLPSLFFFFFIFSLSLLSPTFLQRTIRTHYAGETMAQRSCRAHASGRISRATAAANFAAIFTVSVVENSLERRPSRAIRANIISRSSKPVPRDF